MTVKKVWLILLLVISFIPISINAQVKVESMPLDLGTVKVEQITDEQIKQLLDQMEATGMTEARLEQLAMARGMRPAQIRELKRKIEEYKMKDSSVEGQERVRGRLRTYGRESDTLIYRQRAFDRIIDPDEKAVDFFDFLFDEEEDEIKPEDKIFGLKLFRNEKIVFQPGLNIPTPVDYQLGQGDELIIDVWGVSEMTYIETISPEGSIIIQGVGPVFLSGMTIEEAQKKLKIELGKIYSGLISNNPNVYINVTLGNVRSINVNMVGDVFVPGTYTIPSMSTVFNALYAAGGPTINGSLRHIRIARENKTIARVDLYQFLLEGTMEGNIRLQDQDVIHIEPYTDRVEIEGEIKRPGIYEMKKDYALDLRKKLRNIKKKSYGDPLIRGEGRTQECIPCAAVR